MTICLWMVPALGQAQPGAELDRDVQRAIMLGKAGEFARGLDVVEVHLDEDVRHAEAWFISGFLLKEWYKQSDNLVHRQEAMQRLARSLALQATQGRSSEWLPQARQALGFLGDDCYDDAVAAVNTFQTGDEAKVLVLVDQYELAVQALNPGTNLSAERAAFHKNIAHAHATLYAATSDEVHFEGIQTSYREAIALTPDDATAWYNLAVHVYNRGVGVMKELGLETSLGEIIEKQQASRAHFSEALPAFESALELQPGRAEILLGLATVHHALHNHAERDRHHAAWKNARGR
jgi:tetratricopeptide (TPR) repeat protein